MEESIYEVMERTQIVDKILLVFAVAVPIILALHYRLFRNMKLSPRMARWRVLCGVGAPSLYFLWRMFNAIADYYGLDSVFGLFVNAVLFALIGLAFCALDIWLRLGGRLCELKNTDAVNEEKPADAQADTQAVEEKTDTAEEQPTPNEQVEEQNATNPEESRKE